MTRAGRPRRILAAVLALVLAVGGCASSPFADQNARILERGRQLAVQGQIEQAVALYQSTADAAPRNAETRALFINERDALLNQGVAAGDASRLSGQPNEAVAAYTRVLKMDPANGRAQTGLAAAEADKRHQVWVSEGEARMAKGDAAGAEARARAVLAENAANRGARQLMRRVTEQQAQQASASPELKAAMGRPITLEFRDANLRSIFEVISRTTGINFVFDKDVRSDIRTTIFVRNSNLDDVLKLLLLTNQLERKVINENTLLIFPNTPAKQKEYQELVVRSFYLANADPKQTLAMLKTMVRARDVYVDEKLNLLVIKDTAEVVRLAEKLIAAQDLAEPEVVLEVEVLEISSSKLAEIGPRFPEQIQWGVLGPAGSPPPAFVEIASSNLRAFTANPVIVLNLKQQDGTTTVLANPRIRVKNREKARVLVGEKVPVFTTTSTANVGVSTSVSYLDTGLKLEVEPNIFLDDEVAMKVSLEVSNILETIIDRNGTRAYRLGSRQANTVLRLQSGETQVLAGLISDEARVTASKLPGFGDLPLLGRLFSSNNTQKNKTEIVLLITPRIVRNLVRPDTVAMEYGSGTDAAIGAAPLTIRATAPRALALASAQPGGAAAARTRPQDAPPPEPAALPATLLWAAPAQTQIGRELVVSIGLPSGNAAQRARFDLVYDPKLLQAVPAAPPAAGAPPVADSGRVTLQLERPPNAPAAAPTEVRLRVVAPGAATTQLRVENVTAIDLAGGAVSVDAPPPHTLGITP